MHQSDNRAAATNTSPASAENGVLYVATRKEKYLVEARASALSLKRHCPHLPVCVFTDLRESKLLDDQCFDTVLPIEVDTDCGTEWGRGLRTQLLSLPQSPYQRTFFLDADTRFTSNAVGEIFDILDVYEIALAEDPPDLSIGVKHYGHRMFNSGVILYRKTPNVLQMFEHWKQLFLAQLEAHAQDPMPTIDYMSSIQDQTTRRKMLLHDQLALAQLLSPDRNVHDLKLKVLDEAWNFCGTFAGKKLDRTIHVDHGPHLKADAFTRTSHNAKPRSFNQFTENLIHNLARAQTELKYGSPETCLDVLNKTIRSVPNQRLIQVPLAREMIRLERYAQAQECAEQAILADPGCYSAFVELATALFNQGEVASAAACIERCRSRFPDELGIGGLAQIVHAEGGELRTALAKPDYDRSLMQARLELDPDLSHQLQEFILHQQQLETQSPADAPENFFRSAILGRSAGPAIVALNNAIRTQVLQYQKHLSDTDPLLLNARPARIGITSWGTVMGSGAYMPAHIHMQAWISGVLYLRVPESVRVSETGQAGWIEFGRPPDDQYKYTFTPQPRTIQPAEGMLLLFPAYYWHGTIPHESDDLRISFGFNVLRG